MKRQSLYTFIAVLALALALPAVSRTDEAVPSPDDPGFTNYVMDKIDDLYRGSKSKGKMEMEVKTKHWEREMTLESWSMGKDYSLVRILEPKKEKGTATLKAKDDLFMYLNKTCKTVKITSGMMGGSWMGSHFTNDDLVRHSRLADDFAIDFTGQGEDGGQPSYRFTLVPKPDAPVVWGKIDIAVRQSDLQPLSQLFYDEDGEKVRLLTFTDHMEVDGRVLPRTMTMKPLDGSDEFTRVTYKKIKFDVKLDKGFFTIQRLKAI